MNTNLKICIPILTLMQHTGRVRSREIRMVFPTLRSDQLVGSSVSMAIRHRDLLSRVKTCACVERSSGSGFLVLSTQASSPWWEFTIDSLHLLDPQRLSVHTSDPARATTLCPRTRWHHCHGYTESSSFSLFPVPGPTAVLP